MAKKDIVLLIAGVFVIFAIGGGLGILYQNQKLQSDKEIQQAIFMAPTVKALSSKAVQSIVAYGQVERIEGRSITLVYAGEKITVTLKDNAEIFSSIAKKDPKTGNLKTPAPEKAEFKDIKTGDMVSITLKILADGKIQGESVFIFATNE
jgi:hypothetical protein